MADLRLQMELTRKLEPLRSETPAGRRVRSVPSKEPLQQQQHRKRHHRGDEDHELHVLRKMVKTLVKEQHDLQNQMLVLSKMRLSTESNLHKMEDELKLVFDKLKMCTKSSSNDVDVQQLLRENRRLNQVVDQLTLKVSGVDKIQSSTLQIFEALERLEERYDENLQQLQSEVSKLEFNDAQLTSDVHTMHEDQGKLNEQLKSVKSNVNIIQETLHSEQIRSVLMQAQLANQSIQSVSQDRLANIQNWRFSQTNQSEDNSSSSLQNDVHRLEQQYAHLVDNLPHGK